ncbi:MAG: DUF3343 domain-containing protein [Calditrichaceae bacterium]|nr:DUF3343 domain-containing protein [Calditrichaceae bacterium]
MNAKRSYAILLFLSANHALRAEKVLLDSGIACKLIPVPKDISSECGICVRILKTETQKSVAELTNHKLLVTKCINI